MPSSALPAPWAGLWLGSLLGSTVVAAGKVDVIALLLAITTGTVLLTAMGLIRLGRAS